MSWRSSGIPKRVVQETTAKGFALLLNISFISGYSCCPCMFVHFNAVSCQLHTFPWSLGSLLLPHRFSKTIDRPLPLWCSCPWCTLWVMIHWLRRGVLWATNSIISSKNSVNFWMVWFQHVDVLIKTGSHLVQLTLSIAKKWGTIVVVVVRWSFQFPVRSALKNCRRTSTKLMYSVPKSGKPWTSLYFQT